MTTSLTSKIVQGTVITTLTSIGGFFVWTKHCEATPLDPSTEPLYKSPFYYKYNPYNNFTNADVITRRIPLHQLRPDLLEDAQNGGSRLVEQFCGAIWSGFNYTPQRLIHSRNKPASSLPPPPPVSDSSPILNEVAATTKSTWSSLTSFFSSSPSAAKPKDSSSTTTPSTPPEDLWAPTALSISTYPAGTVITNHFLVLARTPTSILIRCGDSPLTSPYEPRDSDGLFEISATTNFEKGYAEFQLKSVFFNGTEANKGATSGLGPTMWWLHQQYAKMWMESAVGKCRLKKFRSVDAQKKMWEEEKKLERKSKEA
ncbi:uncharacterized protein HMPREF1541_08626 [Cyphellophora europaea CBS 101466]|uniref:Uncharacterized protein n=1 Tax=Cyphellophora europaea (strain CBS 101466) TaxID=1220924 RepID=W2RKU4_CYPE1|nr:uncharacterized protein HMPREF1541_08626 [Cyphellophora europaea CBS 101466]ETN36349.1 hypothetical protein HMPREF1541_08626 [Cyphellophora europaea CBS 101466]